jgi:DNA-binding NtrC family response regulator
MVPGSRIDVADLPDFLGGAEISEPPVEGVVTGAPAGTLQEAREAFERTFLSKRLEALGWNIARTAETVGLERSHLYRKLKALGISVPRREEGEEGA